MKKLKRQKREGLRTSHEKAHGQVMKVLRFSKKINEEKSLNDWTKLSSQACIEGKDERLSGNPAHPSCDKITYSLMKTSYFFFTNDFR